MIVYDNATASDLRWASTMLESALEKLYEARALVEERRRALAKAIDAAAMQTARPTDRIAPESEPEGK